MHGSFIMKKRNLPASRFFATNLGETRWHLRLYPPKKSILNKKQAGYPTCFILKNDAKINL